MTAVRAAETLRRLVAPASDRCNAGFTSSSRTWCQSQWKSRIACWVRGASSSRARQHHAVSVHMAGGGVRRTVHCSDRSTSPVVEYTAPLPADHVQQFKLPPAERKATALRHQAFMVGEKMVQPGQPGQKCKLLCSIVQACSSRLLVLGQNVAVDFLSGRPRDSQRCGECPRSGRGLSWFAQFVHGFQVSLSVASASCCAYSRVALSGRTLFSGSPTEQCLSSLFSRDRGAGGGGAGA